jgi:peptidoglycan-associated lipoprotein
MKLNKIVLPLALALVATLATTGCRHGFSGKTTYLPGQRPQPVTEAGPGTLASGMPIDTPAPMPVSAPNPITPVVTGNIATSTNIDLDNYNQDRGALAAYTVHFKFDSAVVQDKEQPNITSVAQALGDPNLRLLIEGNCDERGTEEYNRSLGERRALALREALAKASVDPMRIKTISYGKDKPADPDHNEAAWAKNRRGDFVLLRPKTPVQ